MAESQRAGTWAVGQGDMRLLLAFACVVSTTNLVGCGGAPSGEAWRANDTKPICVRGLELVEWRDGALRQLEFRTGVSAEFLDQTSDFAVGVPNRVIARGDSIRRVAGFRSTDPSVVEIVGEATLSSADRCSGIGSAQVQTLVALETGKAAIEAIDENGAAIDSTFVEVLRVGTIRGYAVSTLQSGRNELRMERGRGGAMLLVLKAKDGRPLSGIYDIEWSIGDEVIATASATQHFPRIFFVDGLAVGTTTLAARIVDFDTEVVFGLSVMEERTD